jgi:hypothetical protein
LESGILYFFFFVRPLPSTDYISEAICLGNTSGSCKSPRTSPNMVPPGAGLRFENVRVFLQCHRGTFRILGPATWLPVDFALDRECILRF